MLKGLVAELLFGNIGVEIPTYVRSDNSTVAYQVDPANAVTSEKRLAGFLESNRGGLERANCLSVGYIHGDVNTSDGLTDATDSANARSLFKRKLFPNLYWS